MKSPIYHRIFNYDTARLPNRHLAVLEEGVNSIDEAYTLTGATIGYPGWGLIYYLLLSHLDQNRTEIIIETGTNYGCTTIILAQAMVDAGCKGRVVSFENDPKNVNIAARNISMAGLSDRVEIIVGDSRSILRQVLKYENGIRSVFLDASHLYNDVLKEFESLLPKLSSDAIVIFDNTYKIADDGEDTRVNGALKTIKVKYGGNLINLEHVSWYTPGLSIWQRVPCL